MDKMSFGCNNLSWMEFDHNGSKFCIRIRIGEEKLSIDVYYVYTSIDCHDIEEKSKQLLKSISIPKHVNHNDAHKGRYTLYFESKKIIEEIEKMYDMTFSNSFKNIALKTFCQDCYSAYLLNRANDYI